MWNLEGLPQLAINGEDQILYSHECATYAAVQVARFHCYLHVVLLEDRSHESFYQVKRPVILLHDHPRHPKPTAMPANTVNPSLLTSALPSPSTSVASSPASSNDSAPSRKRPRSEMTSEERKEARAHRNRIAAQNSRDRRKAHYSNLEQRIVELEEENRILRANQFQAPIVVHRSAEEERERDKARDKENEELRERIKTLEKGWDAVVKALAAQGLPTGIPAPPPANSPSPESPTNFPVIVPNTTVFPISPASSPTPLPTGSFDFEFDVAESESTRQLARLATTESTPPSVPQQRVDTLQTNISHSKCRPTPTTRQRVSLTPQWKSSSGKFLLRPCHQRRPYLLLWTPLRHPPNPKSRRRPPRRR